MTRARPAPEPVRHGRRRRTDEPAESSVAPQAPEQSFYQSTYSDVVLEPVSRQPYDLSYACLMIPRFSAHYLIGDIAEDLHQWMRQVCISFEWRLESILIRPEYMQWVVFVPANTPPSRCIKAIREHTSRLIFEDFPHIRQENLSEDFWAQGYSVLLGPTPQSPDMINEYIRLTRQRQGIQPNLGR